MNFDTSVVLYRDIMAANCTSSNCTAGDVDTEEFEFTGPMVTGISVSSILVTIILLSICYAKKWCCFMVRYKLQTEMSKIEYKIQFLCQKGNWFEEGSIKQMMR